MYYYIFGMDGSDPLQCAKMLRARGFSGVVNPPDRQSAQAVRAAGMDVWGCIGAFSLRPEDPPEYLAQDAFGERRRWFGSGCPNEPELTRRALVAMEQWKQWGARGVLADGARFASPCPGTELFLSCFCPRCMALGAKMGYDMKGMRQSVRLWSQTPGMRVPGEWLRFREECTRRWFERFAACAREGGLECGAFVFAPSLGALVGQTSASTAGLSIAAPMLYRRYSHRPGIACLNDEYASLHRFYAQRGDTAPNAQIALETGAQMPAQSAQEIWQNGFAPQDIARETARAQYAGVLAPIVQLDDDNLAQTIRQIRDAGARAIGFFAYTKEDIAKMPCLS